MNYNPLIKYKCINCGNIFHSRLTFPLCPICNDLTIRINE